MINSKEFDIKEIGESQYTDSKSCIHTVKHSVILSDTKRRELEEKIAEELYQIFKKSNKVSI